ncbi:hypothetical protein BSPA111_31220 [Buttiauxella sp. A111]|nr:hypothetical protein BSPA111_31220 [Buttiauxella sp. A111]
MTALVQGSLQSFGKKDEGNITTEQKNESFLEEVRDAEIWSEPGGTDRSS